MNDHSPSTLVCSASAGIERAVSIVPAQSRCRIDHASLNPSTSDRSHLRPFRVAPVQLRLDERGDVDAVDDDRVEITGDVDVVQLDPAQLDVMEFGALDLCAGQVDSAQACVVEMHLREAGVAQVDPLEACTAEVLVVELGHRPKVDAIDATAKLGHRRARDHAAGRGQLVVVRMSPSCVITHPA